MDVISYIANDASLKAVEFLELAQRTWPGDYDLARTERAIAGTINITARDDGALVGCVRILTDGYFFGTIPELLVDPSYQGRGIGHGLMELAWEHSPTSLYFGAQPGKEAFYEKLGYKPGLASYERRKDRNKPDGGT